MFRKDEWKLQLYKYLAKLSPEEVIGVAHLLKVTLCDYIDDKPVPRTAEQVFLGIFCTVEDMNRLQRRRFMSFMKKICAGSNGKAATASESIVTDAKEVNNGASTENN